jgi:hypothetical protein
VYNGILLNSVPETYKTTVRILEASGKLTLEEIINGILEEYRKIGKEDAGKFKMVMLTNTQNQQDKNQNGKSKKNAKNSTRCFHCNKRNHKEARCWIKHPELKPSNSARNSKSSQAQVSMMAIGKSHTENATPDKWYLDSSASQHFSPYKGLFDNIEEFEEPQEIETSDGTTVYGIGKGPIQITVVADKETVPTTLIDVVYAPKMSSNLLSTTTILDHGFEISMKLDHINILKDSHLIANTVHEGNLYRLKTRSYANKAVAVSRPKEEDITLWHRRLGHMGEDDVRKLSTMAEGINISTESKLDVCQSCLEGKQHRQPSRKPIKGSTELLALIHCDTSGIINPTAIKGVTNYGTFMDDAIKMTAIVSLRTKTAKEMLEQFKDYQGCNCGKTIGAQNQEG